MKLSRIAAVSTLLGVLLGAPSAYESAPTERTAAWSPTRDHLERLRLGLPGHEIDAIAASVDAHAHRFRLDPAMVLAVIHVESRFDRTAVSSKGAMGLMQLRPSTAREVADWVDLEWSDERLLFDPDVNILLGTCYLRNLVNRFDDVDVALAAYNAGPTRVAARHRDTGTVPRAYAERVRGTQRDLEARARTAPAERIS